MPAGDVKNNIHRLERALQRIHYAGEVDITRLKQGDPSAFLPLMHHALLLFSRDVATDLAARGFELYAKSDMRFMEGVYKILREEYSYFPRVNITQFFQKGFAELKMILTVDLIDRVRAKHADMQRKTKRVKKHQLSSPSWDLRTASGEHRSHGFAQKILDQAQTLARGVADNDHDDNRGHGGDDDDNDHNDSSDLEDVDDVEQKRQVKRRPSQKTGVSQSTNGWHAEEEDDFSEPYHAKPYDASLYIANNHRSRGKVRQNGRPKTITKKGSHHGNSAGSTHNDNAEEEGVDDDDDDNDLAAIRANRGMYLEDSHHRNSYREQEEEADSAASRRRQGGDHATFLQRDGHDDAKQPHTHSSQPQPQEEEPEEVNEILLSSLDNRLSDLAQRIQSISQRQLAFDAHFQPRKGLSATNISPPRHSQRDLKHAAPSVALPHKQPSPLRASTTPMLMHGPDVVQSANTHTQQQKHPTQSPPQPSQWDASRIGAVAAPPISQPSSHYNWMQQLLHPDPTEKSPTSRSKLSAEGREAAVHVHLGARSHVRSDVGDRLQGQHGEVQLNPDPFSERWANASSTTFFHSLNRIEDRCALMVEGVARQLADMEKMLGEFKEDMIARMILVEARLEYIESAPSQQRASGPSARQGPVSANSNIPNRREGLHEGFTTVGGSNGHAYNPAATSHENHSNNTVRAEPFPSVPDPGHFNARSARAIHRYFNAEPTLASQNENRASDAIRRQTAAPAPARPPLPRNEAYDPVTAYEREQKEIRDMISANEKTLENLLGSTTPTQPLVLPSTPTSAARSEHKAAVRDASIPPNVQSAVASSPPTITSQNGSRPATIAATNGSSEAFRRDPGRAASFAKSPPHTEETPWDLFEKQAKESARQRGLQREAMAMQDQNVSFEELLQSQRRNANAPEASTTSKEQARRSVQTPPSTSPYRQFNPPSTSSPKRPQSRVPLLDDLAS